MYSMKEVCQKMDFSYEALKFYCNEGLIPNVKRDKRNYRVFDDNDINWLKSLMRLKDCGMSIKYMKAYVVVCLKGEDAIPQRIDSLDHQKKILIDKIVELNQSITYLEARQKHYRDVIHGKAEFHCDLIQNNKKDYPK